MVLPNSIIYIYWYIYNPLINDPMISFYLQKFYQLIFYDYLTRSKLYVIFFWLENVKTFLLIVLMWSKIQCYELQTKKVLMSQISTNMKTHSKFHHCKTHSVKNLLSSMVEIRVHFPNDSLIGKGKCWYYLGKSNASW